MKKALIIFLFIINSIFVTNSYAITRIMLPNGINILYKGDKRATKTEIITLYSIGAASDPEDMLGLSYIISNIICNDSYIPSNLKKYNLKIRSYTDRDFIACSYTADRDSTYDLMLFVYNSIYTPDITIEKKDIIKIYKNKQIYNLDKLYFQEFYGTDYSKPVLFNKKTLNTILDTDNSFFKNIYYSKYLPKLSVVGIYGHINKEISIEKLKELYSSLKPRNLNNENTININDIGSQKTIKDNGKTITATFIVPNYMDHLSPSIYVLSKILDLSGDKYDQYSLLGFNTIYNPFSKGPAILVLNKSNKETSKNDINELFEILKTSKVSTIDINEAKLMALKSLGKYDNILLSSKRLLISGETSTLDQYKKEIKDVTKKDIILAVKKLVD